MNQITKNNSPRTTESSICKSGEECAVGTRKENDGRYCCKAVVRGSQEERGREYVHLVSFGVKRRFFTHLFLGLFFAAPIAFAADLPTPTTLVSNPVPGAGSTLEDFVYLLIDIIQWVALPLLALALIRAGFMLVSAGGDEKQITSGKLWVVWTLVGAAIVLGARVVANVVFGTASLF